MEFSRSAGAMDAVITNIRNLLKKRNNFKRTPYGFNINKEGYKYLESSPKKLRD